MGGNLLLAHRDGDVTELPILPQGGLLLSSLGQMLGGLKHIESVMQGFVISGFLSIGKENRTRF